MGYYCTSSIEAVRQNGCVQVTYYVEHHEHDINFHSLVHMTLPASVKDKIAGTVRSVHLCSWKLQWYKFTYPLSQLHNITAYTRAFTVHQ